ncbi:hypothetical protein HK101_002442 [Irineochytrium annulatum]|nr:hypothetical protein HK101_002442 [Irineochytrium annulatum]
MEALDLFGGVYQQYAVDDKGQTLLAVFGLAGFSHVNNAEQCLKAMCHFMKSMQIMFETQAQTKLAISIATGETLCTSIGNELRSDPGLLGDVIITAARLMSASKTHHHLVLDEQTNDNVKLERATIDLGFVKVKGKSNKLRIYGVPWPSSASAEDVEPDVIGYKDERNILQQRLQAWFATKEERAVVIEAASGMGKSFLAESVTRQAKAKKVSVCLVQVSSGSEKNQLTPFYSMGPLISFIFANGDKGSGLHLNWEINAASASSMQLSKDKAGLVGGNDIVKKHLVSAGVDLDLAPLLSIVSPMFQLEDTPRTLALDNQAKNNLLIFIVVKIVGTFLDESAAIFIFDDVQWYNVSGSSRCE